VLTIFKSVATSRCV